MIAHMMGFPTTRVVSIAGLVPDAEKPWGESPREAMEWLASVGARGIVLDGTRDGIRARQLDSSGRRAVAALLRRLDLRFRGIDLWIPMDDFVQASASNRAIDAACAAVELCADLHRLSGERSAAPAVNVMLPRVEGDAAGAAMDASAGAARNAIRDAAARVGARIADFGPGAREMQVDSESPLGAGVDPFAILSAGQDPVAVLAGLKGSLHGARDRTPGVLSRAARNAGVRFDALAYRAALSTRGVVTDAPGELGGAMGAAMGGPALVMDLRNEERPQQALLEVWSDSIGGR